MTGHELDLRDLELLLARAHAKMDQNPDRYPQRPLVKEPTPCPR